MTNESRGFHQHLFGEAHWWGGNYVRRCLVCGYLTRAVEEPHD